MRQLVNYRHGKRWDMRMERIADQHHLKSAQDIADIAAYVASLPPQVGGAGSGEFAVRGGETFKQLCSGCHGPAAQGNDQIMVPRIAGQHYQYLLRQIYDALDGRRPNFSRDHIHLFQRFERPELTGIADYLSRLPPVAPP
jgi:cytochrome c553